MRCKNCKSPLLYWEIRGKKNYHCSNCGVTRYNNPLEHKGFNSGRVADTQGRDNAKQVLRFIK